MTPPTTTAGRIAMGMGMALAMAASPIGVAAAQIGAEPVIPAGGALLEVTAEGHAVRTPDVATLRAGVVTQGATAAGALADNAARMARVLAALKRAGVEARDTQTASVSLDPQYRYGDNQPPVVTGYQATNAVTVRFRRIDAAGPVLDALVAAGANQISGPTLTIDQPDGALDEARSDAVARARARAVLYAKAAGMSVDRILRIAEAGSNAGGEPNPPMMMRAMATAAPKTALVAGERDVTASVSVRFLLR